MPENPTNLIIESLKLILDKIKSMQGGSDGEVTKLTTRLNSYLERG